MTARTTTAQNAPCPFCMMMRRAMRNALVGMSISASLLAAAFFTYQRIGGI